MAFCLVLALLLLALLWLWPRDPFEPAVAAAFSAQRVGAQPLIYPGMSDAMVALDAVDGYANINGPSLLRVPGWVQNPLGRYYLYFAHHKGSHIRMAWADSLEGPWTLHEGGVLSLADSGFPATLTGREDTAAGIRELWDALPIRGFRDMMRLGYRSLVTDVELRQQRGISAQGASRPHVASPEVVVDEENRRLIMYYHGLGGSLRQYSKMAVSGDGLSFAPAGDSVPVSYLRAFEHRGQHYLLGMPGFLFRSNDRLGPFEVRSRSLFEPDMRHAGLLKSGDTLYVFWTRVGDAPERVLLSEIDLSASDWNDWRATRPVDLLLPELAWEGADLPLAPSLRGELDVRARELRDPYAWREGEDLYLIYVGGGEKAIGLSRLIPASGN